ncbi:hypothetical protein D9619_009001 [Psilocybe cf. subviscida]|uniref:NAD(P)-binding protein n=1 Tax=Psilocybe cf. subviscida TaxID=2480587 RepID=A0A8H5BWD6_9AGAR|nr:hypothetical protein D9619_009001 [Psilocybe cf. subviscida]
MATNTAPRVWFVTGASSGLGKAVVLQALSKGDKVVATCRKPSSLDEIASKYASTQLLIIQLDVASTKDIAPAFDKAVETFGRVDVVYNNAGYAVLGEAEAVPEDVARRQFDVNFWGVTNVSREAVRVFREVNKPHGGVLLQASSFAGTMGMAGIAFYCASKFALEGYSNALAKELDPSWNIRVHTLEFGSFDTRAQSTESYVFCKAHPAYEALPLDSDFRKMRAYLVDTPPVDGDATKAAREVYNISSDKSIEVTRIPLGLDAIGGYHGIVAETQKILEQTTRFSADLKYDGRT